MKSPKAPAKKSLSPTTTDLRGKDPKVLRAEIDLFIRKISEKSAREPQKAAIILSEWIDRKSSAGAKKKAA